MLIARDVSFEKEKEQSLLQAVLTLKQYKEAIDISSIVAVTDKKGVITSVNDNFCKISQYSRQELLGKTHSLLKSGLHSRAFYKEMWKCLTSGQVWKGEICNKAKDGSLYWVYTTIVPVPDTDKKSVQYMAFRKDISERKQAEKALAESEKLYRSIFESHPNAVFLTDRSGQIQSANEVACRYFSLKAKELPGRNILSFLSLKSRKELSTAIPYLLKGETIQLGGWVQEVKEPFLSTIGLIPLMVDGAIRGFFIKFQDITKKYQHEKELALLNEASLGLSAAPSLEEGMEKVIEVLCQFTGFGYGEFWMPLFGQNWIKMKSHWTNDSSLDPFYQLSKLRSYELDKDLPAALKDKKVIFSNSLEEEKGFRRKEPARQYGLCSYLIIPIEYRGTYLGTIALFAKEAIQANSFNPPALQNLLNKLGGEIERRRSSEELDKFFRLSPDLLCIIGFDGYFKKTNPAFLTTIGYSAEEMLSFQVLDLVHPEDYERVELALQESAKGVPPRNLENRYRCKDGSYRWIASTEEAVPGESLLYVVGRDITRQKQQLAEIEQIKTGIENTSDGLCIGRGFNELTYTNKAFEQLLGMNASNINRRGGTISLFASSLVAQEVHLMLVEKGRWEGDVQILDSKRQVKDFNLRCNLILDKEGEIKFFVGIFTDITEQKKARNEISKLSKAVEESGNELYIFDAQSLLFSYINRRGLENLGYSLAEAQQLSPVYIKPEFQEENFRQLVAPLLKGEQKNLQFKTIHQKKTGEQYPVEVHLSLFQYGDKRSFMAQVIDITEREKSEKALWVSNERYYLAAKATHDAIWDWDLQTDTVHWGDGYFTLFGHNFTEKEGAEAWKQNVHPEDANQAFGKISEVLQNGSKNWVNEYRFRCADGSYKYVRDRAYVIYDTSGKAIRMLGAVADVTEQKKSEKLLQEFNSELEEQVALKTARLNRILKKMEGEIRGRKETERDLQQSLVEKEVLLKEIHHRVKNNMAIILSLLNLQSRQVEQEEVKMLFQESQSRIKSMALIHELLYQQDNLASICFNDYMHQLSAFMLKSAPKKDCSIEVSIEADQSKLEIEQALPCGLILNELITNSLKYAFKEKKEGLIKLSFKQEKQFCRLQVSDNGPGISPSSFQSRTKSLGIHLVKSLVRQLGGSLEMFNEEGAHFVIQFELKSA